MRHASRHRPCLGAADQDHLFFGGINRQEHDPSHQRDNQQKYPEEIRRQEFQAHFLKRHGIRIPVPADLGIIHCLRIFALHIQALGNPAVCQREIPVQADDLLPEGEGLLVFAFVVQLDRLGKQAADLRGLEHRQGLLVLVQHHQILARSIQGDRLDKGSRLRPVAEPGTEHRERMAAFVIEKDFSISAVQHVNQPIVIHRQVGERGGIVIPHQVGIAIPVAKTEGIGVHRPVKRGIGENIVPARAQPAHLPGIAVRFGRQAEKHILAVDAEVGELVGKGLHAGRAHLLAREQIGNPLRQGA